MVAMAQIAMGITARNNLEKMCKKRVSASISNLIFQISDKHCRDHSRRIEEETGGALLAVTRRPGPNCTRELE